MPDRASALVRHIVDPLCIEQVGVDGRFVEVVEEEGSPIATDEWLHRVSVVPLDRDALWVLEGRELLPWFGGGGRGGGGPQDLREVVLLTGRPHMPGPRQLPEHDFRATLARCITVTSGCMARIR